jgi:hypothetical protein
VLAFVYKSLCISTEDIRLTQPNIKNLSVAELLSLRGAIDTALQSKKAELHSQLA